MSFLKKLKIGKAFHAIASLHGITVPKHKAVPKKPNLKPVVQQLKTKGAVRAFVVPPIGISASTAVSAAAKVLAQGAASKPIVDNTRTLAALGDKDAIRGLGALTTAQSLVENKKAIAPPPKAVLPGTFTKVLVGSDVNRLVQKTIIQNNVKVTVWVRIKRWIGNHI